MARKAHSTVKVGRAEQYFHGLSWSFMVFHLDKFCTCALIGQSNCLSLIMDFFLLCLYDRRYLIVITALNSDNATCFNPLFNKLWKAKIQCYVVTVR